LQRGQLLRHRQIAETWTVQEQVQQRAQEQGQAQVLVQVQRQVLVQVLQVDPKMILLLQSSCSM
jgi:flagellar biosynthesis protein FliP